MIVFETPNKEQWVYLKYVNPKHQETVFRGFTKRCCDWLLDGVIDCMQASCSRFDLHFVE